MMKPLFLSGLAALTLLTSACDIEMPAGVYSDLGNDVSAANSTTSTVGSHLRLSPNRISQDISTQMARTQGKRFGVDTALVLGVMTQESGFNANAVSHAGAQGLMQIMPSTLSYIKERSGLPISSAFDPEDNVSAGTWYLRSLYDELSDVAESQRWQMALASYNGGIGRVRRAMDKISYATGQAPGTITWAEVSPYMPSETRNYVPAVMSHTAYYRQNM